MKQAIIVREQQQGQYPSTYPKEGTLIQECQKFSGGVQFLYNYSYCILYDGEYDIVVNNKELF